MMKMKGSIHVWGSKFAAAAAAVASTTSILVELRIGETRNEVRVRGRVG